MVTLDQAGWNRSQVVIVPAPAAIHHVVAFLWIDARPSGSPRAHEWRIVADDAPHVIYARYVDRPGGSERHRLHVVGPRQVFIDADCTRRIVTIGARLKPGALPALFRDATAQTTDQSVPIDLLVRPRFASALARFEDSTAADAVIRLGSLLSELAAQGRAIDPRVVVITRPSAHLATVQELADEIGISDRALRAWSATHVGMGLRRFMTIRRLHRALEHRIAHAETTWSRIAAAAGFADQSHLVRDCHTLLGESPSEFLTRAG